MEKRLEPTEPLRLLTATEFRALSAQKKKRGRPRNWKIEFLMRTAEVSRRTAQLVLQLRDPGVHPLIRQALENGYLSLKGALAIHKLPIEHQRRAFWAQMEIVHEKLCRKGSIRWDQPLQLEFDASQSAGFGRMQELHPGRPVSDSVAMTYEHGEDRK